MHHTIEKTKVFCSFQSLEMFKNVQLPSNSKDELK